MAEVRGVVERFYDTHIPRSLRRFVTPGRYSICFQKRYCITFYEHPLSSYPGDDTRAVDRAGADRYRKDRVCLILSLAYLTTLSNCDESNMRMIVNDEEKTMRKRL